MPHKNQHKSCSNVHSAPYGHSEHRQAGNTVLGELISHISEVRLLKIIIIKKDSISNVSEEKERQSDKIVSCVEIVPMLKA